MAQGIDVDISFGGTARVAGTVPVLKALSEVWQVVGTFLGLSGGFCFFVILSNPQVGPAMYMSAGLAQSLVVGSLAIAFGCSYLGAGLCMTYIGNSAYLIRLEESRALRGKTIVHDFVAKNDVFWSIPAYMNFIVVFLTMFSLTVFSFCNFQLSVAIFIGVFACGITLTGFFVSKRIQDSRVEVLQTCLALVPYPSCDAESAVCDE
jgi:hypothetical protein